MTEHDKHQRAVLEAHARYADCLASMDAIDKHREEVAQSLKAAEAELRALARASK